LKFGSFALLVLVLACSGAVTALLVEMLLAAFKAPTCFRAAPIFSPLNNRRANMADMLRELKAFQLLEIAQECFPCLP
jgi:hypothetical protein